MVQHIAYRGKYSYFIVGLAVEYIRCWDISWCVYCHFFYEEDGSWNTSGV